MTAGGIDAVAIIGMAGRFPGAETIDQFWENLRNGVESIAFFTDEELLADGCPPEYLAHPAFVKAKGALDGVSLFDASFFGYTPKEAQLMDPQQRLFLECGWHALENAGYDADVYRGLIGVYAGVAFNQYLHANVLRHPDAMQAFAYDKDFLTTRLSYRMNLKGPSLVVQTACSTSLVAVCQACQSLLSFQCDMALAGGIAVTSPEKSGYFYQEGGILSPDGHCRPFDARAQGTVMGSGIGLVVLKRLDDAMADGDRIRAVIRGFAVNNDGAAKMGYTAPSIDGQAQVIRLAQALGDVTPDSIGYIEAHGTATKIGDPIEVAALTQAFRAGTNRAGFCAIGSVKSNIGHLDTAAGIAGLIKAALALEHRELPPSLHFSEPNPEIDFANSPFFVNTKLAPWNTDGTKRRAGVSSFGIGGTNAHVVLEESPEREPSSTSERWQLLTLSARSEAALETASANLLEHLKTRRDSAIADVAYTLHVGRKKFPHARAIVCRDIDDATAAVETQNRRRVLSGVQDATGQQPIVFMFPGQGAQHPNMAREIYRTEPVFRQYLDDCCARLRHPLGFDLHEVLYPSAPGSEAAADRLHDTLTTQCALFAVEYALAQLWMSWGVKPNALIGHSVGEYVAACLSGVLSLEDALTLVVVRGRLMQSAAAGAMVALPLGEDRVRDLLRDTAFGGLSVAAVNASSQCVVAGTLAGVEALEERLRDEAVTYQRLRTAGAFHSSLMSEVAGPLTAAAREVRIGSARIPYVSNVTGEWITETDLRDPGYWGRHALESVRFGASVDTLLTWGAAVFLEVGPGQGLGSLVRQIARTRGNSTAAVEVIPSLPSARDDAPDGESVVRALGRLWLAGIAPDWQAYHANEGRLRVELPTYPFERKRYWAEPAAADPRDVHPSPVELDRRADVDAWFAIPSWSRSQPPALTSASPGRWLVFLDGSAPGEQLAGLLARRSHEVIRVRAGDSFGRTADHEYLIRPASRSDYHALLSDLRASDGLPDTVLHLWMLSGRPVTGGADSFAEECLGRGFFSLLYLAQAWGDLATATNLRVVVVGDRIHDVTGSDGICPEKATVLGAVRVMPQEYHTIGCRLVDVVAAEAGLQPRAAAQILAEIESDATEPVVAYRGIDRWVETVEPVQLPSAAGRPSVLRDGGTYLISGGYGAIGLEIARHLASAVRANVILVGRGGMPARELWQKHVSLHGRDDEVSRTIRAVQALEESGADVLAVRADVANEMQMREVVAEARRRFGRIDGVFHAAGIAAGGVMQLRKADDVTAVMRPKITGTRVLARVLADEPPDFLWLCSSLNAVTGGVGQADYCAANAYLDAFARSETARGGTFTISVNWDTWREAGMAADARLPGALAAAKDRVLAAGMTSAEGLEVFQRSLRAGVPQLLVSTGGWRRPAPLEGGVATVERGDSAEAAPTAVALPINPRPSLASPFVAPQGDVDQKICGVWREALGVQQVGMDDSFFDLGGHSLLAIQVMARLNADFGTAIPVAKLYEGLTPAFLAGLVRDAQPDRIDETGDAGDRRERHDRQKRQKRQQEKRRVARTGQGGLVQ